MTDPRKRFDAIRGLADAAREYGALECALALDELARLVLHEQELAALQALRRVVSGR